MRAFIKRLLLLTAMSATSLAGAAHAQITPLVGGVYAGGGFSAISVDDGASGSARAMHFYGGLDLLAIRPIVRFGLEAGHLRSSGATAGAFPIDNFSGSATATLVVVPMIDLHARIGYEGGEAPGAFYAAGGTFRVLPMLGLRGEYSRHDGFDALTIGLRVRIP